MAVFLHAAGFHCLTFDVPAWCQPLKRYAERRPSSGSTPPRRSMSDGGPSDCRAISGHSMGAIGRSWPVPRTRVQRIVATSAASGPYRLTRQTFRLAHLPITDLIAYPLAC